MYTKLMVPLDGSEFAEAALPAALALSRRIEAPVHLVSVVEPPPLPPFAPEGWEDTVLEWSQNHLDSVRERIGDAAGGDVTCTLLSGTVADMLDREADVSGADLIVMATHGRGALSRMWLGSVADDLVHRRKHSVLLVRAGPRDVDAPDGDAPVVAATFSKILIPLDGSELSESALEPALALASLFGAHCHLVRVVLYAYDLSSPYISHGTGMDPTVMEGAKRAAERYLNDHATRSRQASANVDYSVRLDAQAGAGILEAAEEVGADLIVMASRSATGLERRLLGSAADKVLRGANVPVLLHRGSADVT